MKCFWSFIVFSFAVFHPTAHTVLQQSHFTVKPWTIFLACLMLQTYHLPQEASAYAAKSTSFNGMRAFLLPLLDFLFDVQSDPAACRTYLVLRELAAIHPMPHQSLQFARATGKRHHSLPRERKEKTSFTGLSCSTTKSHSDQGVSHNMGVIHLLVFVV